MPELPKKKIGLISCSGEEMAEGTITRRAVRRVLDALRPDETVTLCLPLFLAGGEGERAFARYYPTIAVDGCDKRCAALATEKHSARPAAALVVRDIMEETVLKNVGTARRLSEEGKRLAEVVADRIASKTDEILRGASRRSTPRPGKEKGRR